MSRAALLLALLQLGCISHWEVQPLAPVTVVQMNPGSDVLVTRRGGTRMRIHAPAIAGDSLVGTAGAVTWPETPQHVAVALADISTIAARQPDPMASVLVGAMITIGAVAVTTSMLTHGWP